MGKNIDKRLRELGAVPFHTPTFADEATNMEETVEPWLKSLYPALRASIAAATPAEAVDIEAVAVTNGEKEGEESGSGSASGPRSDNAATSAAPASAVTAAANGLPSSSPAASEGSKSKDVTEVIKGAATAVFGSAGTGAEAAAAAESADTASDPIAIAATTETTAAAAAAGLAELSLSEAAVPTAPADQASGGGSVGGDGGGDQRPWSPREASGALPVAHFLSPEHMVPGYAPAGTDLPRARPAAPDVRFHKTATSAAAAAAAEGGGDENQPWLRRARQRSSSMESRHTLDWPFAARVKSAKYLTEGGVQVERR